MPKSKSTIFALAVCTAIAAVLSGPLSFAAPAAFRFRPTLIDSATNQQSEQSANKGRGTVRVSVMAQSGAKVAGAALSIGPEGESPDLTALTRDDGTYRSPQLAAGRYEISVVAPCYQPWHGSVEIDPDYEQALNITLTASTATAGETPCGALSKPVDSEVQFSDSTALKPSGISGSVDAGGYSSQAQGTQLRAALGELGAGARSSNGAEPLAESNAFSRGNNFLLQGDYRQAISVFQHGTAQYPRSAKLLLGLGVAYYSSGRYADAVSALCKAVDLNPSDRAAYFFLAQTYAASPVQTDAVLSRLERYSKREPQDAGAQYYYALCLWRSRAAGSTSVDAERVEQLLRSSLTLDPSLVEAHYQLGVVLAEQRQDAQAVVEFERVITSQPEFAEAHYRLAQIYQRTGQKDKARAEIAEYDQLRKWSATGDQKLRDDVRKLLLGGGGTTGN